MKMTLVDALDFIDMGLVNGNVKAARGLLHDLRPQAVEIMAKAVADTARLDWLESRGHVSLTKEDGVARCWDSPPCVGAEAVSIRDAIDIYRCS